MVKNEMTGDKMSKNELTGERGAMDPGQNGRSGMTWEKI